MKIRPFNKKDLAKTAAVHKAAFVRQQMSTEWIASNFQAYPRVQYFVAETKNDEIVGYIHWCQKGGFRSEVVLELEQLAVHPGFQGQGIGTRLIRDSLPHVKEQLASRGARVKHVIVTTRTDNHAQKLYRKTLGAEIETTIRSLYSADEVFMIARNVKI